MLDIRSGCNQWCFEVTEDPQVWREQYFSARRAGALASGLHNFALASAGDFEGFDEDQFWSGLKGFSVRFPEADFERYRTQFEQRLAELMEGK